MKKNIIFICYDYKAFLPYFQSKQAIKNRYSFSTNCLEFFNNDLMKVFGGDYDDIVVVKQQTNEYISLHKVINTVEHTRKDIRSAHNVHKMLIAEALNFIPIDDYYNSLIYQIKPVDQINIKVPI